ncbi:GroES-like protein [Myriangium duriaei CBS 260.36]|uniref:GroES-like protein n=1 Tax=Myriangium duriaei CBS 260.36 TaxID=1168546 RepID=A0A9P4MJF0_9PEZI|nr:GroES-like protein [Myriangium duriaei CBS 260.36]
MPALKSVSAGKAEVQTVPLPKLRDTYILAKVHSVALNPTDWKHVDKLPSPGATVGCDFVGTVEAIGSKVTKKFSPGDRIIGFTHGVHSKEPEDGAFAEYALVKGDLAIKAPSNLSNEEAATLGVGVSTVGQGLYQSLELPLPGKGNGDGAWLLVYGGSTATGSLAIQYGRLSGYRVISTNSPRNNSFVESLGAEKAFDYRDPEVVAKIREYTGDNLHKVFDTISEGDSGRISGQALSSRGGGKISTLLGGVNAGRDDVKVQATLAYSITGEDYEIRGNKLPAAPQDFEFGKQFWALAEQLLADGKIKVHPPEVKAGGLDKIVEGLDDLRQGRVSGKKVVYNIQ